MGTTVQYRGFTLVQASFNEDYRRGVRIFPQSPEALEIEPEAALLHDCSLEDVKGLIDSLLDA